MISPENIELAFASIDEVFLNTPQYKSEGLSEFLRLNLVCKIETLNPIGCFKGRGVSWLMESRKETRRLVAASSGNFGQAIAYIGRKSNTRVDIFAPMSANLSKITSMEHLGAHVHLHGHDFDTAKDAAIKFAESEGITFLEDGRELEVSEGAGTIGLEISRYNDSIDIIYVPVGNGALVNGIGSWCKARLPMTKVIGVCAEGAPAMERSWHNKRIVKTDEANTIADGLACRVPVSESVQSLPYSVDDMILVADTEIISAMQAYFEHERLLIEPAGAASLAAAMVNAQFDRDKTVVTIATGSNLDELQLQKCLPTD